MRPGVKETWGLHGLVKDCASEAGRLTGYELAYEFLSSFYPHVLHLKLCFVKSQTILQNNPARMPLQIDTGTGFLCKWHD